MGNFWLIFILGEHAVVAKDVAVILDPVEQKLPGQFCVSYMIFFTD